MECSQSKLKGKLSAGLKDLSLIVMEQVIQDGQTTYSKVASELIKILKQNSNTFNPTISLQESDDDEEILQNSENSYEIEAGTKKANNFDKREKNIRRRVYDALNVQFAAGVLVKTDNKHI